MDATAWPSATLALAAELIGRASVTPEDAGCQQLLAQRLEALGFDCTHLRYGEVDNLWAVHGSAGPLFVFAGHTDVVPPGPLAAWTHPPFEPRLVDGMLHGRGAADMKGSLAAMVTACERLLAAHEGGVTVAAGTDRFIPRGNAIHAYSRGGSSRWWTLPDGWETQPLDATVLSVDGRHAGPKLRIAKRRVWLKLAPRSPVMISRPAR